MYQAGYGNKNDRSGLLRGPSIGGHTIYHNDGGRTLIIDSRLFRLSPTQYDVCLYLLQQRERWERGQGAPWTGAEDLLAETHLADQCLLRKHVNRTKNILAPTGITLMRVETDQGDLYQAHVPERDVCTRRKEKVG